MLEKEAEEWVNNEYDNSYFPDCNFTARQFKDKFRKIIKEGSNA